VDVLVRRGSRRTPPGLFPWSGKDHFSGDFENSKLNLHFCTAKN
jgi:hypothetical protein